MKDNVIKTNYGYEIVWATTASYTGKILVFEKLNTKLGLHFHKQKNKSWFVNSGKFRVQWIDTADGKIYAAELLEGSTFHVPALMPVSLENLLPNSAMAETGDADLDHDIFKLN
jgi:uncharacterized RmlC-like cupin family protein